MQEHLLRFKNSYYVVPVFALIALCIFYSLEASNKKKTKKTHVLRNTAVTTILIIFVVLLFKYNAQVVLCEYGPATF